MDTTTHHSPRHALPAVVLIGAGLSSVLVMTFHPTAHGADIQTRLRSLAEISPLSLHVHMAMIGFIVALWCSLAYIARQWPTSGWVWLATRLYAIGASAMLGAALISGFLVGAYLARMAPGVFTADDALPSVLLAFSANQVLAGFGTIFLSLAIALWSVELVRSPGRLSRVCGYYGIAAGGLCIAAYAARLLSMNVTGMTAVVAAHGAWYCLLGLWALRGRTPD